MHEEQLAALSPSTTLALLCPEPSDGDSARLRAPYGRKAPLQAK